MATRKIHINSVLDRRIGDTTDSWVSNLNKPIVFSSGRIGMRVIDIEIPNTYYTFPTDECVFYYYTSDGLVPPTFTLASCVIDTDRYFATAADFLAWLNAAIVASGLVFTYSSDTGKLTVTNNNAVEVKIASSYIWQEDPNTNASDAMDRLGFTDRQYTIVPAASYTAPSILRLNRTNCMYLACDKISSGNEQITVPNPYSKSDILARVTASNFGIVSQLKIDDGIDIIINETNISSLGFEIRDDNNRKLPLNGAACTFTLAVRNIK